METTQEAVKFWEPPKEISWWTIIADGKVMTTVPESAALNRDKKRLSGLCGIEIVPASREHLQRVHAATTLPRRITRKMEQLYRKHLKKLEVLKR